MSEKAEEIDPWPGDHVLYAESLELIPEPHGGPGTAKSSTLVPSLEQPLNTLGCSPSTKQNKAKVK